MRTFIIVLFVVCGIFSISSCGQKKGDKSEGVVTYDTTAVTNITIAPEYYFSGNFIYMADAAVLKETATGVNLPVAKEELYPQAEKQYMDIDGMGKEVYAELSGFLKAKGSDEEGPEQQLVITRVITMDKTKKTNKRGNITGTYTASKNTLEIAPDHTYTLDKPGEPEIGKWYLYEENIMVLKADNKHHLIIDMNASGNELKTREATPVIYKKK